MKKSTKEKRKKAGSENWPLDRAGCYAVFDCIGKTALICTYLESLLASTGDGVRRLSCIVLVPGRTGAPFDRERQYRTAHSTPCWFVGSKC